MLKESIEDMKITQQTGYETKRKVMKAFKKWCKEETEKYHELASELRKKIERKYER